MFSILAQASEVWTAQLPDVELQLELFLWGCAFGVPIAIWRLVRRGGRDL